MENLKTKKGRGWPWSKNRVIIIIYNYKLFSLPERAIISCNDALYIYAGDEHCARVTDQSNIQ